MSRGESILGVPGKMGRERAHAFNSFFVIKLFPEALKGGGRRRSDLIEMFCLRCREKVQLDEKDVSKETTAKGRPMLRAKCPKCGAKMTKFVK